MAFIKHLTHTSRPVRSNAIWRNTLRASLVLSTLTGSAFLASSASRAEDVNVYSYRQPELVAPLFDRFTQETGIRVNVLFANKGLVERVQAEGENSPVDLLFTVDIGRLSGAEKAGITQPVDEPALKSAIPAAYRDDDDHWFGLTLRSRVIYASRDRVAQDNLTYADLANPEWKGRICTRSGQHAYSIGLIASQIAHQGLDGARDWLTGVRDNLARKPTGNDRAQAQAIFAGECDIALGNTYYFGLMQTNDEAPEQKEWASSLKIIFPDAEGVGSHVNISGMALAKHAPNRDNAIKLMTFLASDEGQKLYAESNFEYPVNTKIEASEVTRSWGTLNPDPLPLSAIADLRDEASRLVDEVGFDAGPQM